MEWLEPGDECNMLVGLVDIGGNLHPIIRLVAIPDMDEDGRFLSTAVNIIVDVGADDGENLCDQDKRHNFR